VDFLEKVIYDLTETKQNNPYEDLENDFKNIRRKGPDSINDASVLIAKMGFGVEVKIEQMKSGLLILIHKLEQNPINREILLMSLGMLKGYDIISEIGKRRDEYYLNGYPSGWTEDHRSLLHKTEDRIIRKLVKRLYRMKNIPDTISEASETLLLPAATYPEKEMWSRAGRPLYAFHNYFPIPKIPHFAGRKKELEQIYNNFNSGLDNSFMQILSGLGGVGKTQIVLEFLNKYGNEYDTIWWFTADNDENLVSAVSNFVLRKGLAKETDNIIIKIDIFVEWLENHSNWLLIFDNVENMESIRRFCPMQNNNLGHIAITTRLNSNNIENSIVIDVFDNDTATNYLLSRTGSKDEENASLLAALLGYLPLALEQAAAYMVAWPNVNFVEYVTLLTEIDLSILGSEYNEGILDYSRTVLSTWKVSMNKINLVSARHLLRLCAYFSSKAIDYSIFTSQEEVWANCQTEKCDYYGVLSKELTLDLRHKLKRKKIISELTKYSLVTFDYDTETLSMNHLLQEVIIYENGDNTKYLESCLFLIDAIVELMPCDKMKMDYDYSEDGMSVVESYNKNDTILINEFDVERKNYYLSHIFSILFHATRAGLQKNVEFLPTISYGFHILGNHHEDDDTCLFFLEKSLTYARMAGIDEPEDLLFIGRSIGYIYGLKECFLRYGKEALNTDMKCNIKDGHILINISAVMEGIGKVELNPLNIEIPPLGNPPHEAGVS